MSALASLAWLGNACFFSRFLVQWWASERARASVAPPLFWWLSLAGAASLGAYVAAIGELVLLPGFVITTCVYSRNLWIHHHGTSEKRLGLLPAILAAIGCALALLAADVARSHGELAMSGWTLVGLLGQIAFGSRFVLQWWASERHGRSHFPTSFWWTSLAGNACLLAYAAHLGNAALLAGYVPGPIVQIRNLVLAHRARASGRRARTGAEPSPRRARRRPAASESRALSS